MATSDAETDSDADLRDIATLLYQNGAGVPFLTCMAGAFMVIIMPSGRGHAGGAMFAWCGVLLVVALFRALDIVDFNKRRARGAWSGRTEVRRYAFGTLLTGLVYAAFPIIFFRDLGIIERTNLAITLSAITGGSIAILGAIPWLEVGYSACLLLPASVMFFLTPGSDNQVLAVGGVVYLGFVASQTATIHRGTTAAVRTSRSNQRLQAALSDSLETLEERIKVRTADLERAVLERDRYGRELARVALRDSLTGLYNRHTLAEQLENELQLAEAAGTNVAVLFIDLDKFKEVNDVLGHHAGDHVLREVANRVGALVPTGAILARWGGDEFVFVQRMPDAAVEAAFVGERLRRSVSEPISIAGEIVHVGATIGIAVFPHHGQTADELVRAADMAMYAAKEAGRDRVRTYDPSLADELGKRHQLEQGLREAIASDAFRLEYQPIVDAPTDRCLGFEALLRWHSPVHGIVPPSEFIPLAERLGEINPIGRWVLERACADAATWPGSPERPVVSVNVSVAQIVSGTLLDDVCNALARSGLEPSRLHLEVTESLFAGDHEQTIPTLSALRALGIRILLDDFGTGFSSLGYLRALPIDVIKIDKSFITAIGESRAIVEAIITLARAIELDVIAEGVETAAQAEALQSLGVRELQGFYFSRSVHPDAVPAMLLSRV